MSTKVIHAEWVGKHAKVIKATNKSLEGLEGVVIDETRNHLVLETKQGIKQLPKKGTVFTINNEEVSGDDVLAQPEERIKLKVK